MRSSSSFNTLNDKLISGFIFLYFLLASSVCLSFDVFTPEQDLSIVIAGTEPETGPGSKFAIGSDFAVIIEGRKGDRADGIDVDAPGKILVFVVVLDIDAGCWYRCGSNARVACDNVILLSHTHLIRPTRAPDK